MFNRDTGATKRAAKSGPVVIVDRGRSAHVLPTIEAYRELTGVQVSIADLLAMPDDADIGFKPPHLKGLISRLADLS